MKRVGAMGERVPKENKTEPDRKEKQKAHLSSIGVGECLLAEEQESNV
jgi:hypothetical protein